MKTAELTESERRYLLKKVKADIQNGAPSIDRLTMLYTLENKLTLTQSLTQPKR